MTASTSPVEPWGPINALVGEAMGGAGMGSRVAKWVMRGRTTDGQVELGPGRSTVIGTDSQRSREQSDIVVCASGNLALVYLDKSSGRLTLENIEDRHPGMVEALAGHDGIGFILVRSRKDGALVIGPSGRRYLDRQARDNSPAAGSDEVEGDDPLALFGPDAADDLRRLDAMSNVGDLVLNSRLDPDTEEVAAFEELVGSHGGLGGWQTKAFLLHPAEWAAPSDARLLGAPAVHRQLVRWLESAGVRARP